MSKLTLAQANKIIEAALANARQLKIKPLAVAVLDDGGHIKSVQREDDATMFRVDVAVGKARRFGRAPRHDPRLRSARDPCPLEEGEVVLRRSAAI